LQLLNVQGTIIWLNGLLGQSVQNRVMAEHEPEDETAIHDNVLEAIECGKIAILSTVQASTLKLCSICLGHCIFYNKKMSHCILVYGRSYHQYINLTMMIHSRIC